ncbi:MAG: ComEC/Rec2 family competence protein [Chloroflexota bacterium]
MPLLWLSLAFLCGILLGEWLAWPVLAWLWLSGLALGLEFLRFLPFAKRLTAQISNAAARFLSRIAFLSVPAPLSIWTLLLFLGLGAARYQVSQPHFGPDFIAWYNDQEISLVVEGVVDGPPDERDTYTYLRVRVERLHPVGELLFTPVGGALLAKVPPYGEWRYGDLIRLEGELRTPFSNEAFSYQEYLARQGIHAVLTCAGENDCALRLGRNPPDLLRGMIYDLRQRAMSVIYRFFPDPEASLMAGILLGIESGIPESVQTAFKETGTSHIIAISGFNFSIIAVMFTYLFGRLFGRWRGMLAAFVGIAVYAMLAGAGAAVIRAAIMGVISQFGKQMGRRQNGVNTLLFVAAVMALFDPYVPWDVGFQLSFMATLGLVLYTDPLSQAFTRFAGRRLPADAARRLAGPVGEYFLFTMAAQVTTLPVTIYHFQRLSLSSLLANPLILPVQPPVMILGGLAVLVGLWIAPLGQALAYLTWPFIGYTIRMVEFVAQHFTGSVALGAVSLPLVLAFYFVLFAWPFVQTRLQASWARQAGDSVPRLAWVLLLGLGVATIVVWQVVLSAPDGRLHLSVLDVSGDARSGDALLIQTPLGRTLLVDGGPSPSRLSDSLGRRLPLTRRSLDYLIVASVEPGQLDALPGVLERFPASNVLWSGAPLGTFEARSLQEYLAQAQIPVSKAQAGQVFDLGEGARLRVLTAGRDGSVLLLEWGYFSALLPVGLNFESMQSLLNDPDPPAVTALLLTDSGYAPLNPPEWIARWQPQVVLLSVSAGDAHGLPDPEVLDSLAGYTLLRTDRNGWIELSTDGRGLWVEVERR